MKKSVFWYYTKRYFACFSIKPKNKSMQIRDDDRIKQLILNHVKGELDDAGERELRVWREANEEHEEMFQRLVSTRNLEEGFRRFVKSPEAENWAWERILNRTTRGGRRARRLSWIQYAAMFALPLVIGGIVYFSLNREGEKAQVAVVAEITPGKAKAELILPGGDKVLLTDGANRTVGNGVSNAGDTLRYEDAEGGQPGGAEEYHLLRIPRGGEYTLVLADGTTVYLNAESELRYPVKFSGERRKVYLRGEAYFDVARDEQKPFTVEARGVEVLVLGTSFGVRAYEGEENVLTTLVQGRVDVSAEGQRVKLIPGQQADFNRESERLTVAEVDVELYVGWKDGRLVFDNQPLSIILDELGRWYSFDVTYANEELKRIPYSVKIKKHEDIAHVLKFIERTGKVKFEINENKIRVK